jgi:hypothetical protein
MELAPLDHGEVTENILESLPDTLGFVDDAEQAT